MFSNSYDLVPTGRLTLEICEWCARRKSWTDGKRQRIEDRLNRFVVALVETAVTKRQWRKDREEQRRRWEEESRRRLEEQSRVQRLENALAQWRRAEDLRAFIAAARQHTVAGSNGSSANVDEWIEWAATYADRIDPLIGDPRFL